jgi:hypothetical protein
VPPEIRTCDRRSGKLTQSCRPFRTSSDYPFGLLRGTERSESWGALHNTLTTVAAVAEGHALTIASRRASRDFIRQ